MYFTLLQKILYLNYNIIELVMGGKKKPNKGKGDGEDKYDPA